MFLLSTRVQKHGLKLRVSLIGQLSAVRALAYKWIRIIFGCWKDSKPYDEATYIQSLRRRGSPVVEKLP